MLRGLAVDADVETGDTEVGNRARERRLDLERTAVRIDGLLGVAAVGEGGSEAVPEEVVLKVSSYATSAKLVCAFRHSHQASR